MIEAKRRGDWPYISIHLKDLFFLLQEGMGGTDEATVLGKFVPRVFHDADFD